jgi:hypothetical protein
MRTLALHKPGDRVIELSTGYRGIVEYNAETGPTDAVFVRWQYGNACWFPCSRMRFEDPAVHSMRAWELFVDTLPTTDQKVGFIYDGWPWYEALDALTLIHSIPKPTPCE